MFHALIVWSRACATTCAASAACRAAAASAAVAARTLLCDCTSCELSAAAAAMLFFAVRFLALHGGAERGKGSGRCVALCVQGTLDPKGGAPAQASAMKRALQARGHAVHRGAVRTGTLCAAGR